MKIRNCLLLVLALGAVLCGADTRVIRRSSDCKIVFAKFNDPQIVKVGLTNADVEVLCKFRADDFSGRNVVLANPEIRNLAGKELVLAYHVAFFSKDGEMIGAATQQGSVRAEAKALQFGSCIITAPPGAIARISSYQVVVYVDDPKPKK